MQHYTVYLYLSIALHVSGGISTHRQELLTLYLQHLALLRQLLLPVVDVTGWELNMTEYKIEYKINVLFLGLLLDFGMTVLILTCN